MKDKKNLKSRASKNTTYSKISPFLKYKNGILFIEGVPLTKIIKTCGSPTYLYSKTHIESQIKTIKKYLYKTNHQICFAVKANPSLAILSLMAKNNLGADIVSGGELYKALRAGIRPESILFSGVGKTNEEILYALKSKIYCLNVESPSEIININTLAKSLSLTAPIGLRFNPNINPKTHPGITTGLDINKFGLDICEIYDALALIKNLKNISLCGINIHIGSQLMSLRPLNGAFSLTQKLIKNLQTELTYPLKFIDLGGGVGIQYKNTKPPQIKNYVTLINKYFGPGASLALPLKVIIEPGRVILGNSGLLLTRVIYKKERKKKKFIIVDASMTDLIRPALYDSYHEIIPISAAQHKTDIKQTVDVVGPVCESSDVLGRDRLLSKNITSDDYLVILSAGAYGFSMASRYNSHLLASEVLISGKKFRTIRKRETFYDLIRGETT